ncbi:hydrogen peroxide-inducible genes activator [Flavobacterium undicola]|uniref:hydrogen peroxide-inducible genes activator n=1 Tax=Flavobacterium undicola TaxID=1932779 RepID=UPI001377FE60|nr:hydrogen peroxide-inducible genes activator [Flavobacterium undicola]MBA0882441.1 LysR family transcriptional regulator [Flavobacterium undicola]
MTLQQLKYIIALDKERHFARAAEACFVSQPGLTLQLKSLEEEIGIKIFDRSTVPLKPTLLGASIIAKAKKVLKEVDSIRDFVIDEKNILEGEIKLGIISTLSPYLIPMLIKDLRAKLPKIIFTIKEETTVGLMKDLEEGAIDIAIMATPTGNSSLLEFPVFYEPFVAFINKSYGSDTDILFKLSESNKADLLLLQDEYCFNAQLLDICNLKSEKKAQEKFFYNINSIETLKNLVRADLGFAILPELSIINEEPNNVYKSFEDPKPVREISLVVSDTFAKNVLLEKIREVIWDCLPQKLKQTVNYKKISWNDSPYFKKAIRSSLKD